VLLYVPLYVNHANVCFFFFKLKSGKYYYTMVQHKQGIPDNTQEAVKKQVFTTNTYLVDRARRYLETDFSVVKDTRVHPMWLGVF